MAAPKISVIISVYNTEKYLKRCLNSVLKQSYNNIEIIIVTENTDNLIKEYKQNDSRIKYIKHEENKARLAGIKESSGEYIAFLNGDDYISLDFYRVLLKKAQEKNFDIVIGNTIFQNKNGSKYTFKMYNDELNGKEIKDKYFKQKSMYCLGQHTVCNKIYKKELIDICMPYFKQMTEDIVFLTVLFYMAENVSYVNSEGYFRGYSDIKNISDTNYVFEFIENFLDEVNADTIYKKNKINQTEKIIPKYKLEDYFFSLFKTKWNGDFENIKEKIYYSDYEYISFDIFDTLVTRPFYSPVDLFLLLDKKFKELFKTNINFSKIRIDAEKEVRKNMKNHYDITIDEIYDYICSFYKISMEDVNKLKEEEKRLEIKFCSQRKSIKEIFDFVQFIGKKVIFISDMYLDKNTIVEILSKNGYSNYEKLYLSSETKFTKDTGELFKYVLKDLNISASKILHIGDTYKSDVLNAKLYGIDAVFYPKAIEVFESKTGIVIKNNSLAYKSAAAIAANCYFNNPYISFDKQSRFNADPYFIGFYIFGIYLFGLKKDISEKTYNINEKDFENYEKIFKRYLLSDVANENKENNFIGLFVVELVQRGVYNFSEKFYDNFAEYTEDYIYFTKYDSSLILENYFKYARNKDIKVFENNLEVYKIIKNRNYKTYTFNKSIIKEKIKNNPKLFLILKKLYLWIKK